MNIQTLFRVSIYTYSVTSVFNQESILCIFSGKCFVDIAEEMKEVYAVYCRNHDDAISLMEKVHVSLYILF